MGFGRQILNEAADRYEFRRVLSGDQAAQAEEGEPDIHPFTLDEVNRILQSARVDYRNSWRAFLDGPANR